MRLSHTAQQVTRRCLPEVVTLVHCACDLEKRAAGRLPRFRGRATHNPAAAIHPQPPPRYTRARRVRECYPTSLGEAARPRSGATHELRACGRPQAQGGNWGPGEGGAASVRIIARALRCCACLLACLPHGLERASFFFYFVSVCDAFGR